MTPYDSDREGPTACRLKGDRPHREREYFITTQDHPYISPTPFQKTHIQTQTYTPTHYAQPKKERNFTKQSTNKVHKPKMLT